MVTEVERFYKFYRTPPIGEDMRNFKNRTLVHDTNHLYLSFGTIFVQIHPADPEISNALSKNNKFSTLRVKT